MINSTIAKHIFHQDLYQLPHGVLVLIPCEWDKVTDTEQQLLAKILSSVKLSLAAVHIVTASSFTTADALIYEAKTILSFGVPFKGVNQSYEVNTLDNVEIVYADAIGALDDLRKKNLWVALRQVFKL
ncbi:hypothetical protein WBG78_25860 [Chryseolinea sp. T2]|uniref:hypothetical protein n=1 Tax=Chryseolinea sp. T2 TaxID=3129255 RepID=UPI003076BFB5